jgi:hypothetical protein
MSDCYSGALPKAQGDKEDSFILTNDDAAQASTSKEALTATQTFKAAMKKCSNLPLQCFLPVPLTEF